MLTQKQYDILQLIDERTKWEGDVRPGTKLTCYFNPSKSMWSEEKRDHVNIGGSGDAAIIRGLWNKGYAKQHGPINPYASVITEDGMLALQEYRQKQVCPVCQGDKRLMASTGDPKHPLKAVRCDFCNGTGLKREAA